MLKKLKSKRFCRSISKLSSSSNNGSESRSFKGSDKGWSCGGGEVKWEVRPGGMLVQKRDCGISSSSSSDDQQELITLRVSNVSNCHHISVEATSSFGEVKMMLSMVTGMEAEEQRIVFKGKEREDREYLHMVGVRDKDKLLLLQDPAIKAMKLRRVAGAAAAGATCSRTISV